MIFQLLWKKWKSELAEPCTDRQAVLRELLLGSSL